MQENKLNPGSMLSQKTNEDFNKKKPSSADINTVKIEPGTAEEAQSSPEEMPVQPSKSKWDKSRKQRINFFYEF